MQDESSRRVDASLDAVKSRLPPLLVSEESFANIRQVARSLPSFAVDFFGFECRLGAETLSADCALNLTPDGARMLAGRHPVSPPRELQNGPWEKLRSFYQVWGDTRQPPYDDARATWLEFDTSTNGTGVSAPNLLFGYWPREEKRPPEWIVDTVLPMLLGGSISPKFRQNIARCLEARPPETKDFQIGVMFSRNIQAARLCVFDLPEREVFSYLAEVGWGGDRDGLAEYLDALRPHADYVGLHLDIAEKIYPHIGIEPNFVAGCWTRQPQTEPRWHALFEQLSKRGLLVPEKRDALLSWTGHQSLSFDGEDVILLRGLSHVKVVVRPGAPAVAKAYFGIAHRPLGAQA
jgi:hypothetical protein